LTNVRPVHTTVMQTQSAQTTLEIFHVHAKVDLVVMEKLALTLTNVQSMLTTVMQMQTVQTPLVPLNVTAMQDLLEMEDCVQVRLLH